MASRRPPHRGPSWEPYVGEPFHRNPVVVLIAAIFVAIAATSLFLLAAGSRSGEVGGGVVQAESTATTGAATTAVEEPVEAAVEATGTVGPLEVSGIDGPYIEATLQGKDFVLKGIVPNATLAGSYLQSAEVAYSPFVRSELMVDEELEEVDWLASGPSAILLLPMITDATVLISDGQVELSGRSPTGERARKLEGALVQVTGLPVTTTDMTITDLNPPSLTLSAVNGRVELIGRLPDQSFRDSVVEGAVGAYGADQVVERIEIDPGVFPALWMYSGGPLLQAMSVFPEYELIIEGTEFSGFINGGVTFEPDSAEFSGDYARVLDVGVGVLTRDQSLQLVIEGHTDSLGPAEVNLALSQRRAEAVLDYFVDRGIDPGRLTAVGKGELEPAVSNATPEGRDRNRRIEYILTSSQ